MGQNAESPEALAMKLEHARSLLFLPASNRRAIEKARGLACDMVILDLEDAVPDAQKDEARGAAIAALAEGFGDKQIGRAHVCTPVTNAHIVCRLLLEQKTNKARKMLLQPTTTQLFTTKT